MLACSHPTAAGIGIIGLRRFFVMFSDVVAASGAECMYANVL